MKRILVVLTLLAVALFAGCRDTSTDISDINTPDTANGTQQTPATPETPETPVDTVAIDTPAVTATSPSAIVPTSQTFNIGILQIIDHPALDAAREGFMEALSDHGITASYDYQNAAGDGSILMTAAERFVNNSVDLVLAIATPSVQTMAGATTTIPIVGTAITSYEVAGVIDSNEAPGTNVTGSSDLNPIPRQIDIIKEFVPHLATLGIAYNSSEDNSVFQMEDAKAYAESIGLTVVTSSVVAVADVQQNMLSLASGVDAIWLPTDNTHANAMPIVGEVSIDTGVPVFPAEESMVRGGGIATLGIDYTQLGYEAGRMAYEILAEGKDPAEMPIRFGMDVGLTYFINGYMADQLGLTVPERLVEYVWNPEE
ncbi:MAG: ABC transporter substrate-binding protein [Defluviitaleaceae bacterium]|nr:ABC transporter substrate-binding protein [Defluviitaleaceae bacterium]